MSLHGYTWRVKRFGRRTSTGWFMVDDTIGTINLVIQAKTNCLVLQNATVLESVPLFTEPGTVQGYFKGDILLIKFKSKEGQSKKFRLLFARDGDPENPRRPVLDCVNTLRLYFPIRDASDSLLGPVTPIQTTSLTTIFKEFLTLKDDHAGRSLELFGGKTPLSGPVLDDMVRLCLLDSTFPAFVSSVEKSLKLITQR